MVNIIRVELEIPGRSSCLVRDRVDIVSPTLKNLEQIFISKPCTRDRYFLIEIFGNYLNL